MKREGTAGRGVAIRGLVLIFVLAAIAVAQPPTEPGGTVTVGWEEEGISLEKAIEAASKATGRTFLYGGNSQLAGKKIFLIGKAEVPPDRLYEWWQSVFVTQGFAILPLGPEDSEFLLVEPVDQSRIIKQRARFVSIEELEQYRRRAGEVIVTTIPLAHVEVASVRQAVTQMVQNRQAEFMADVPSANALIVLGFAPTVYAIYQLAQAMDVPSPTATLRFEKIELKWAVAEELQPIITDLIATGQGAATPGRAAPARPGQPAVLPGQEKPEPKLIADPRTNSLVVYAVESDVEEIKRLVSFLDTEATSVESNIRIYYLKNTNADDIAETLRELVGQSTTRSGRATGVRGGAGQRAQTTVESGQDVVIVPDGNTNALLISCTRTRYAELEKLIEELDRRRPQVLVQAAIAELSESDIRNLAVELTAVQGGDNEFRFAGGTGFGLSTIANTGDPATDPAGILSGLARIPFATATGISFSGLAAGIFQNDLSTPLLINMLKSTTKGNLVSVPSVLTNDNEQSTITVGRQVPTVTFSTTAAGTDNQSFQNYEEASLVLTISPHISSDNYIRMEIELLVDAFLGAVDIIEGVPPPKTTRSFTGSVTVPNGRTVVIGGLVQDNYTESVSGIPFLSDIPILGELFKSQGKTMEKTTLYLFVTPTIFNTFQQLEQVSYQKKLEISKLQGNVKLIDPNFRAVDIEDPKLNLEDLERSGYLDMPEYAPVRAVGTERPPTTGIPVKPQSRPGDQRATIPPGGTQVLISGGQKKTDGGQNR